jgi:glycosyltransferase involved in cell wall biosynthesis
MKIAIYFTSVRFEIGGGYIQAVRTAQALQSEGHDVKTVMVEGLISVKDIVPDADVHHFISAHPTFIPLMRDIRRRNAGLIALSTIYWWTPKVQRVVTPSPMKYWRYVVPRYLRRAFKEFVPDNEIYKLCDLLLPNSPAEGDLVKEAFPIGPRALVCPVPNAAVPIPVEVRTTSRRNDLPEKYVLCAGSFNTRKNQLGLVRALRGTSLPVVFLGDPGLNGKTRDYKGYYAQCRGESTGRMTFVPHLEHGCAEWVDVFSRAAVFAMPSACETPSLAALEAGLFGAAIAITSIGSAYEYFGPHADYCDPADPESIRTAVERAWARGRSKPLADHVASRFYWKNTGRLTVLAYRAALTRDPSDLTAYEAESRGLWFDIADCPLAAA